MNKKTLTIAIALVILAIIVVPVAAMLPATSPLPSGKPYDFIWQFLQDLQNQIKSIPAGAQGPQGIQGPPGPSGPAGAQGKDGTPGTIVAVFSSVAESGTKVDPLPGYTKQQCQVIVSPYRADCQHSNYPILTTVESFASYDPINADLTVHASSICWNKDFSDFEYDEGSANYMMICTK